MKEPKVKGRSNVQHHSEDRALDRLHQFEEERGLPATAVAGSKADRPTRKRLKPSSAKGKHR